MSLQAYLSLNINNASLKSHTFNEFSQLINSPHSITPLSALLKSMSITINPKIIYLSYTISHFSKELFYNSEPYLELLLLYKSHRITSLFETFLQNQSTAFVSEIKSFIPIFKEWQTIDASLLTDFLQNSHNELNTFKQLLPEQLDNIQTKQQFIQQKITLLQQSYPSTEINNHTISSVAEKAFWDLLTESLKRFESQTLTTQDITWIINILQEILDTLNSLTPNNPRFLQENNNSIDIPFIKQRIEHNSLDSPYLNSLIHFIMSRIQLLQAPSEDSDTNKWISLTTQLLDFPCHYYDLLPIFFRTVYSKLFKIQSQLSSVSELLSERN